MSSPPFLQLPDVARAEQVRTTRGTFAVHQATPSGRPRGTALLVPGFTGSKEDFIAVLEPLADAGYRVVAMDQRGQYETPGPRDPAAYGRAELARDVVAVTDALDSPGPVHLLGHSFGGLVVRTAVLHHGPARWASLTLLSSGPAAIDETEAARVRLLVGALASFDLETIWQAKRELEGPARTDPGGRPGETVPFAAPTSPAVEEFLHRRWLATVPEHLAAVGEQLLTEPDRVAELAAVGMPTLVLSGGVDHAWPVPWMDEMARRLRARRVVIPEAGHSPNAEFPERTAAALAAFWDATGPDAPHLAPGQRGGSVSRPA
ncbi:hydrolase [Wenjunlia vitaminophila]|uniref:Hydrolase n=1 Tax=Wenjunlia vitaminophila TaxID=76728 RepID=A0A0T6LMJ0_WENVI|nr:alpha/beta fold hydrolase [Wenjunlia vitaminophila]KRV47090.1 hydrolase [Wenjunlia vitaminophila]